MEKAKEFDVIFIKVSHLEKDPDAFLAAAQDMIYRFKNGYRIKRADVVQDTIIYLLEKTNGPK